MLQPDTNLHCIDSFSEGTNVGAEPPQISTHISTFDPFSEYSNCITYYKYYLSVELCPRKYEGYALFGVMIPLL